MMNGDRVDDEAENVGDSLGGDEQGWLVLVEAMGGKTRSKRVDVDSCLAGNIWKKFKPLADEMAWNR